MQNRSANRGKLPLGFFAAVYQPGGALNAAYKEGIERYFARKSASPALVKVNAENGASLELFLESGCRLEETGSDGRITCIFPAVESPAGGYGSAAHDESDEPTPGDAVAGRFFTLRFNKKTGEFGLCLNELTPLQVWYARVGDAFIVSNDLRCFRFINNPGLDETALRLLLVYQSLPPTLSVLRGVRSVPALHTLILSPHATEPRLVARPVEHFSDLLAETSVANCARGFAAAMEKAISRMQGASVNYVCFSGGVDSAYIAWRLRKLGAPCHLVFYSFIAGGELAPHARRMAESLGLSLTEIDEADRDDRQVLAGIPKYYEFPFSDLGTLTSLHLAQSIARFATPGALVWDGTAADGLLMMSHNTPAWKRLYRIPLPLRRLASWLYERFAWSRPGKVEYALRTLWRTVHLPLAYTICTMKTPPADLAVRTTAGERQLLQELYGNHVLSLFAPESASVHKREILGTFHRSVLQVSPKSASALRHLGIVPVFPFMHREPLGAATSIPRAVKYRSGQVKPVLTHEMENVFGRELLYRPKSGFAPPAGSLLEGQEVLTALGDELSSIGNPLHPLCDPKVMRRAYSVVRRGVGTDTQVHKFLWTYLFTTLWLRGTAP